LTYFYHSGQESSDIAVQEQISELQAQLNDLREEFKRHVAGNFYLFFMKIEGARKNNRSFFFWVIP